MVQTTHSPRPFNTSIFPRTTINMKLLCSLAGLYILALTSCEAAKCVYYGSPGETGEKTATGEKFDPMGMTASALPNIPFNSNVQVTNQRTGRSIVVRVNDRYGAPPGEDTLDLTYGAFAVLANHDDGVFPCSYSIIS